MKQIALLLILILFSCKGQSVDTLEEVKNSELIKIEVIGLKPKTDSLFTSFTIPKTYLLKSSKKIKFIDINYYNHPHNNNQTGYIIYDKIINPEDSININLFYYKLISIEDFKKITNQTDFKNNEIYKVIDNNEIYNILEGYKKDDIRFRYYHKNDLNNTIAKSISVNLE
ncbi:MULTISPECIES: hypothetical protein [unclassified Empedobacter]|uniref:hypothetical protein n=1 Tax=unclassified Empedobacter TaxID=2643773 RepID=UPI0025BDE339|nr:MULTISPECIES: hypothetical protein [unclassified Empedobacter]